MELVHKSHDRQIPNTVSFKQLLQSELIRRCNKNSHYSLRAYAKSLGLSHATLSSILSGKRPLTKKSIIKLSLALNLGQSKMNFYLAELNSGQNENKTSLSAKIQHQQITLDTFAAISDWYHDAILELTRVKNFIPDVRWIAKSLGISRSEARIAIERLQRLDLLEITAVGRWNDLSRNNTTNITNDITNIALKKLQNKVLQQSAEALQSMPRTKRDHTSLMVAMNDADLAAVKEKIKEFRFELVDFIERKNSKKPNAVYQFSFSVFPLTKQEVLSEESESL